ncbi:MAG: efflux RND transporter periplasmic adaptor subunit [Gemmatimonadaceae bacterium]|nr:efflux RND transporter periplasmic adaptor subunit [Gemmatimonadaceae bacterium]
MSSRAGTRARAIVLLPLLAIAAACSDDAEARADSAAAAVAAEPAGRVINVQVAVVAGSDFAERIRLTGTVTAYRDVTISAEETGVIRQLPVAKGSTVGAGQVIAAIDDRILRAQVAQARAQAELTREVADRRHRLFTESTIGTELSVLEARSAAQQAAANLDGLSERLARTRIRAPISGVLDERNVEIGTMVAPGTPVARIIALSPAKVTAGVPERFAADVVPGSMARVTFDVLPGRHFDARIDYVGAAVNARNRTFPIEIALPNQGFAIKPEMVANVEILKQRLQQAVVVPQEALVRIENGFVVFVVEEDAGRPVARRRPVLLGPSQRNQVVVQAGLDPGDRLIVVGQNQVAHNDRVNVVAAAPSPVAPPPVGAAPAASAAPAAGGTR